MNVLGLSVIFDGKKNLIVCGNEFKEYAIGGLACEFARLHPTDIKKYIIENPYFSSDLHESGGDALVWFYNETKRDLGEVISVILSAEFGSYLADFNRANEEELQGLIDGCNSHLGTQVSNYILEDTGFDCYGVSNVGQAMLSAYEIFAGSHAAYMVTFNILADGQEHEAERVNAFLNMYGENVDFQHIDFKIMLFDGKFHSVFTISSAMSLILFEAAHALDSKTTFVKCKNCGHYFVPTGRSDSVYCGYPAPNADGKACRDIGAQQTHTRKLKNDTVAQEYRRLYMRLKMAIKRHPEDSNVQERLAELTDGMKQRRQMREEGSISSDDILEWLGSMDQ